MQKKVDAAFAPIWEGSIKAWTIKQAKANHWRVSSFCSIDDLIQDGYLKFLQCKTKYSSCENMAHFASLYYTAYRNHLHSLATAQPAAITRLDNDVFDSVLDSPSRRVYNSGPLLLRLSSASPQLQSFLKALQDEEVLALLRIKRRKIRKRAKRTWAEGRLYVLETTNQRWCRIMGFDPTKVDLVSELRTLLKE